MADWHKSIAALERRVMRAVEQIPFKMIGWTLSAKSSAVGDDDEVETGDGDDSQRPVRRIEPWGHRGRAPKSVRTLQLKLGSSTVLFLGVASTNGYGPTDLEDGETALYNSVTGTEIRLDKDGNVKINTPAGKTVQINGADHPLPKWDTFLTAFSQFIGTITASNGGGPILTDGGTLLTALANGIAAHTYESTKAKNG